VAVVVALVAAAATSVGAVSTEEVSVVVSAAVALVLAVFAEADFAQPRPGLGALILPVEVSAEQPVRSDITTEAAARLLLGQTNSADGQINR
jgi:hypothetical protein